MAIGGTLAILGLLVLLVGIVNLPSSTTHSYSSAAEVSNLAPGAPAWTWVIPAPSVNGGVTVVVNITANNSVDASLLTCVPSAALPPSHSSCYIWGQNSTNPYATLTDVTNLPYLVWITAPGPDAVHFHVSFQVSYVLTTGVPLWQASVIIAAGALLIAFGGIAAFLGFYLKGNPYEAPPPEAPLHPGEAEDAAAAVLPDEESPPPAEPAPSEEPAEEATTETQDPTVWDPRKKGG